MDAQDIANVDPHPRCPDCGEVMTPEGTHQEADGPNIVTIVYRCPNGHLHPMLGRRTRAAD